MFTGRIDGVARAYTTPVEKVTLEYSRFGSITRPDADTVAGFVFTQSGFGEGFNEITRGECGGLLNLHGKYMIDPETGESIPPVSTMMFTA